MFPLIENEMNGLFHAKLDTSVDISFRVISSKCSPLTEKVRGLFERVDSLLKCEKFLSFCGFVRTSKSSTLTYL